MNDTARMLCLLARDRHAQDWDAADAWQRLHAALDAEPLPSQPDRAGLRTRIAATIVASLSMLRSR